MKERDKIKLNDKINQNCHIVLTNKTFNSLKIWLQYLEEQENEKIDIKDVQIFRKHIKIMQQKNFWKQNTKRYY